MKGAIQTMLRMHCTCHLLTLACTDANKDIEYISTVERILTQLWKYFEDSSKRTSALIKTQFQLHQLTIQ